MISFALSLTLNVMNWLADSRYPRILHIFERACNLINERGELLSIVTPQIGNGPFNLVLETEVDFSARLQVSSTTSISSSELFLGDFFIPTDKAVLWSPRPDWELLNSEKADIAQRLGALKITQYQPLLPQPEMANLALAVVTPGMSALPALTSKLAGLGAGLTPAGDDFMLGAILAAWILHPLEIARLIAGEIGETAAPLTTSLSGAWLRSAARGEAGILWHMFFDALISADAMQIQNAADKILAVGETSGADALSGFMSVFKLSNVTQPIQPSSRNGHDFASF